MYHNTIEHGLCIFSAIGQRGNMNQGSEQKMNESMGLARLNSQNESQWTIIIGN